MEGHILSHSEIDIFVSNLTASKINEIGNLSWFESHKRTHMLYQEALLGAINGYNESIKEAFLLHGKMKILVYEAICMAVWRHNVFPHLSIHVDKDRVFAVFVMFYQESTAFGLLETLAYHADCVESLQDSAVELLDYCVQNILLMINRKIPRVLHEKFEMCAKEELDHYEEELVHNLGIRSVCVLRFIAEAFELLSLSITSRFYNNHDIIMLLCQVVELAPWFTTDMDGKAYHYIDGNWKVRESSDGAINKSEGQTWLCLRQALLDQRFLQHYELNDYRRRTLCKLIRHLHDDVLDQLSPLAELKHFLCQLTVANIPPAQTRPVILELVAEYREKLMQTFKNKWEELSTKQAAAIRQLDIDQIQNISEGLAQAYTTLDFLEEEPPKCANCGDPAAKRCSRCKCEWYCGRECQVKNWDKHKPACDLVNPPTKS